MQKILALAFSYVICKLSGVVDIWFLFTPVFIILSYPDISETFWEIPIGVMLSSIIFIFLRDHTDTISSILLVGTSAIYAASRPRKLLLFYPITIMALFATIPAKSTAIVMTAALWCAMRDALKRKVSRTAV